MKLKLAALFICLQFCFNPLGSIAGVVKYSAPTPELAGKFSGEISVDRLANLALPDGLLTFRDDEVIVQAVPEWLFDREEVLKGSIVRAEILTQKNAAVLAGLVYFNDGQWLKNLAPGKALDQIVTKSGEKILGRIASRSGQAFILQQSGSGTRKIAFSDIKSLVSPRAFSFNIPAPNSRISATDNSLSFDAETMKFAYSSNEARLKKNASLPASTLAGADPGISKAAIGSYIALDLFSEIAPAIAIPLVLNPSTQRHALKQISAALRNQL
ncbi:MAG: hypothetical protein K2X27_00365 [Candidatus Obscuribacterales bacterium]|nr:hypothetical protein [Candidatus Obscuribacterales bacterium]